MNESELRMRKQELRSRMKTLMAGLSPAERAKKSDSLALHLCAWPGWKRATTVLSYLSLASEVDTEAVHRAALAEGKVLALPRIDHHELIFHRLDHPAVAMTKNRFGIREPAAYLPVVYPPRTGSPRTAFLILVPGLAFDRAGGRLGRGGGFYDRLLSRTEGASVMGVCFGFQLVEQVPTGPEDRPVEWITTERRLIRTESPST